MSMTPPDYGVARDAALGCALGIVCMFVLWSSASSASLWEKGAFGFLAALAVFVVYPISLHWINQKERSHPSYVGLLIDNGKAASGAFIGSDKLKELEWIWGADQFSVRIVDGEIKVSTIIRDDSGKVIAQLRDNEWKTAPPPEIWDRNYTDNSLEVINAKGEVVLQIHVSGHLVQLQGVWWRVSPSGLREKVIVYQKPGERHGDLFFCPPQLVCPEITPMFRYPSETHLGELSHAY